MVRSEPKIPREDLRGYRAALGSFGTGVAIVTAVAKGNNIGMTINSFTSVSLQPPLVLWSIGLRASNLEGFCAAEQFAVHVLGVGQRDLSDDFAISGGDCFAGASWAYDAEGVPELPDCIARFQCRRHAVYAGGDHQIILGEVQRFVTRPGAPLLFVQGRYLESGENRGE